MNWEQIIAKRVKEQDERGQSIVLIVFMIIGILAFVGLAADTGFLFARSAQFSAAVDAAALAGVVELHEDGGVISATNRAGEFLDANGWPIAETLDYTGTQSYTELGLPQFTYTVTWPVQTFFLRVIGFEEIPTTRSATAAYHALADMPTPTQKERGIMRVAGQYVYGPDSCAGQGDPVSAVLSGVGVANSDHPIMDGAYLYRIRVPSTYVTATGTSQLEIQLFDPDTYNGPAHHSNTLNGRSCSSNGPGDSCIIETGQSRSANPIWLQRVDETWTDADPGNACPSIDWNEHNGNTVTRYTLYFNNNEDKRVNLASFEASPANAASTDMRWVSPGSPGHIAANSGSFTVNLSGIPQDDEDNYNVYMEVEATAGTSKNGFEIWAGSPALADTLDPYPGVNERNQWILDNFNAYDTRGVQVFAQGYMPTTVYLPHSDTEPVSLAIAAVDTLYSGGALYVTPFDFDATVTLDNNIAFRFDSVSTTDFYMSEIIDCGGDCNNKWVEPQYAFGIPSIEDGVAFYGGNFTVDYAPANDEHVWALRVTAGRPFLTR